MSAEPPFERYPGPAGRSRDVYRVISPRRDALAWISIIGRLMVVRFFVRDDGGWRTVIQEPPEAQPAGDPIWELDHRDPVELVFTTLLTTGIDATALVSVTRRGCEIRVETDVPDRQLNTLIAGGDGSIRLLRH